jgi:hypothetical protein
MDKKPVSEKSGKRTSNYVAGLVDRSGQYYSAWLRSPPKETVRLSLVAGSFKSPVSKTSK